MSFLKTIIKSKIPTREVILLSGRVTDLEERFWTWSFCGHWNPLPERTLIQLFVKRCAKFRGGAKALNKTPINLFQPLCHALESKKQRVGFSNPALCIFSETDAKINSQQYVQFEISFFGRFLLKLEGLGKVIRKRLEDSNDF